MTQLEIMLTAVGNFASSYPPWFLAYSRKAYREATESERSAFVSAARAMDYDKYLLTVHWSVIKGAMFHRHKRCQFCGGKFSLQVHHSTYEHRGTEFDHMEDLNVLCRQCHKDKHGLASVAEVAKIMERRMNAWKFHD